MLRHFRLVAALSASCALAGCGIKGPLALPPANAPTAAPASPSTIAPAPDAARTNPSPAASPNIDATGRKP